MAMAQSGEKPATPHEVSARPAELEQTICAARAGNRESLGQLVAQCRGYLLAIAHAELDDTLRGKLAVSDVVQETLLRVQEKLPDFRGNSEPELLAWIRQILLHYIADVRRAYRQTNKRQIDREVALPGNEHSTALGMDGIAIDSATPGRAVVAGEEMGRLRAAIGALSDEYRTVLTLRTWERLSFVEVGKRMNRSPDAARMLWARAVQQLSQQLQDHDDESS
jgi:RNA polymerase sigma-70 factor (ECF subfamily)